MIKPLEITLSFNPSQISDINGELHTIFNHPYARGFWNIIKRGHITHQYFNGYVIDAAIKLAHLSPRTFTEFIDTDIPYFFSNKGYGPAFPYIQPTSGYLFKPKYTINDFIDFWHVIYQYAYVAPDSIVYKVNIPGLDATWKPDPCTYNVRLLLKNEADEQCKHDEKHSDYYNLRYQDDMRIYDAEMDKEWNRDE